MADFDKNIRIHVDTNQAVKSINELEKEVVDLEKEMTSLARVNTEASNQQSKALQKTLDAKKKEIAVIKKAKEEELKVIEQSKAANKERTGALIEAGVRVTQAFVTTTATIASFVATEEDATVITAKLGQAMAVADSIEQVYNATTAIGEARTKSLAAVEAQKTAVTLAGTTATGAATTATTLFGRAIQFALGPIGLIIGAVTALVGGYFLLRKSAADTAKEQDKLNESVNNFAEATDKASAAQAERNRSNIKDNITNQRQAIKDEQKATKDRSTFLINEEKALVTQIQKLRDEGAAFDSKEIKEKEDRLFANRFTDQVANQALINNLVKKSSDFEVDTKTEAANKILDLDIEKLSSLEDFESKRKVIALNNEKALNEINARIEKGDATANTDKLILAQKTANDLKAIAIEEANFQLDIRNQATDQELEDLSLIETTTARFQEIELTRKKELDAFNTAINNGEIKSATELENINSRANNKTLSLLKQIKDKTKLIADETSQISLDLLISDLNEISQDIEGDLANQLKAISETTTNDLKKLDEEYSKSIEALGDINTEELEKQADELTKNYEVKKKVIEKGEKDAKEIVNENNKLRTFAEKSAIIEIEALQISAFTKIKDSSDFVTSVRIENANKILAIEIKRLELLKEEEIRVAENAKKSKVQIDLIKAKYDTAIKGLKDSNKEFVESLKLEKLLSSVNKINNALTKLSEIKVFSENNGINNFLNSVTSAEKALVSLGTAFTRIKTEFKKPVKGETPEQLKERVGDNIQLVAEVAAQAASEITNLINETVQAAFQANIDSFNKQLEVLNEKKAEIDEELQTSADKIKDLQGNLAQANIEDRSRIIKLIEKERQREKELQKQKAEAARQELAIQEKIKEEKRKAFNAQKAASIAQAIISTALGVITPWTNPLTVTMAPALSAIIGALGAVQIGIIASQPVPEFKVGGFTERDNDNNKAVGVVHANEWVAPSWMVKSAKFKNTIQELESQRAKGYATGGLVEPNETTNLLNNTLTAIQAISERPVVVSVQEINSVSNKVQKTQVRSTL